MSYADQKQLAGEYSAAAAEYSKAWLGELPHITLENELVRQALGDCTGQKILDIAGGSGGHARSAIAAGATHIDVVDISQGMMDVGKKLEDEAGRNVIDWHLGDMFQPLCKQISSLSEGGYDKVMAIWAFDHARTVEDLEEFWQNVAYYLKPGAPFVGLRVANVYSESATTGKYGSKFHNIEKIPGGVSMKYTIAFDPPFTLDSSTMEACYGGSTELPEKYGITDIQVLPIADTDVAKKDLEFWKSMIDDPHFVAFTGRKR